MAHRRGRHLGVALGCDVATTTARLEAMGLTDRRAVEIASAAIRYANEEADQLARHMTPRELWPGHVCLRRHMVQPRDETWLVLRYDDTSFWILDAVFVA